MLLREYEYNAARRLAKAGVESPRLCAQLLVGHVLGLDRLHCVLTAERELALPEIDALEALTARRALGEPLAHILGAREFFGRDFLVTPDTLIPRPETELLVETALELLPARHPLRFADLGAGSGCIGVTLCLERPQWRGMLLELSVPALCVARENAARLGAAARLDALRADMHSVPLRPGSCDLVVSNPPYIADAERNEVMDEVLLYEPHTALFSPQEGLAHLGAVISQAARILRPGGLLLLEHGARQGPAVRGLLSSTSVFNGIITRRDLAGLDRCALARKE
ncbi:peptide chain release factor N(5)-glutamine methyltransferase [uncultured Desulfovibrio sp.]|uniref:peptide chain release factor N(5)-glutamine methyltransferase n=1 Tax=uncultured Desulfovibrio sp. TaxID=167968 RepID=UPI00260DF57F|nr:peptide chain release factor N(5)-glutamine methyltransferase [uncultured Desulfovibrio sp.]